jgi:Fe-S cluster assembly ATP-binding protein
VNILELKNVSVEVGGKSILDRINLSVPKGESQVLFGPNGSGKTTLLMAILGIPGYTLTAGGIIFNGRNMAKKDVDERARLGIGFGFQQPPEVVGVKLRDMLKVCEGTPLKEKLSGDAIDLAEKFQMTEYLDRDVNVGFSGGERKRAEILQLLLMKPKLLLLDEPDSGVDVESLVLIATEIQKYLDESKASALIITHQGHILEHIKAEKACLLIDGRMYCYNKPKRIFEDIKKKGYSGCIACHTRKPVQNGMK